MASYLEFMETCHDLNKVKTIYYLRYFIIKLLNRIDNIYTVEETQNFEIILRLKQESMSDVIPITTFVHFCF